MHTVEYYSAVQKDEILQFVATWMELVGNTLNEIHQAQERKCCKFSLICGRQKSWLKKLRAGQKSLEARKEWLTDTKIFGGGQFWCPIVQEGNYGLQQLIIHLKITTGNEFEGFQHTEMVLFEDKQ